MAPNLPASIRPESVVEARVIEGVAIGRINGATIFFKGLIGFLDGVASGEFLSVFPIRGCRCDRGVAHRDDLFFASGNRDAAGEDKQCRQRR